MIYTFLADGFEEIEALVPVDILKRGGHDVKIVGVTGKIVKCARETAVICDLTLDECDFSDASAVLLPGGPGTSSLDIPEIKNLVRDVLDSSGLVCAICAAPYLLGQWGFLDGKNAVCFPGYEQHLKNANFCDVPVCVDLPFITARGAGAAL